MNIGLNKLKNAIEEAECVLIGIGEDLTFHNADFEENEEYETLISTISSYENLKWMNILIKDAVFQSTDKAARIRKVYEIIYNLVKEKNYYFITQNYDSLIWNSPIKKDKIVAPCGSVTNFQCQECRNVWEDKEYLINSIEMIKNMNGKLKNIQFPICPQCGKHGSPNIVITDHYEENGYLAQWKEYTDWLQRTLNRKLCILELGVGFTYPTVIRWPFEKTAYFNQKASFFRVHETLYQLSEQLKDRGVAIKENPINLFY